MRSVLPILWLLSAAIMGCEGPQGPIGPRGEAGRDGEPQTFFVTSGSILNRNYTKSNESWVSLPLGRHPDPRSPSPPVVLELGIQNPNGVFTNMLDDLTGVIWGGGDYGIEGRANEYYALLYDPLKEQLNRAYRVVYVWPPDTTRYAPKSAREERDPR